MKSEKIFIGEFFETLAQLQGKQEFEKFLRDVATIREITEMAKRWKAAQMLDAGISYRTIAAETGLSTATVVRVAEWLQGDIGGYRIALNNLHHAQKG